MILFIALTLTGTDLSLDLIFSDKEIRTDTGFGWSLIIVQIVNAFLTTPILMVIVQRARQILDYVLTFHFFHLLCVWYISGHFPTNISWWILQVVNIAIMTFGGEWACMHREMKPIMITSGGKKKDDANSRGSTMQSNNSNNGSSSTNTQPEDEQSLMGNKVKQKRKTSDAEAKGDLDDEGALLAAVGKAKKALLAGKSSKRNASKKYEVIPMKDMDYDDDSASNHSMSQNDK